MVRIPWVPLFPRGITDLFANSDERSLTYLGRKLTETLNVSKIGRTYRSKRKSWNSCQAGKTFINDSLLYGGGHCDDFTKLTYQKYIPSL